MRMGNHADRRTDEYHGIRIELKKRPEILPAPVPIYETTFSELPEMVRISFTNGVSEIYERRRDQEQAAPVIMENIRIIRKWKQEYVNQPARRRRGK